jgi:pimeloyl-ACP methyl ester carboxylesterase
MAVLARGTIADIDGVELHWAELGQGDPLVMLHGLSDSHRTWDRIATALARTRRVIMPDLAGHGLSGRPDASYTLEWHAELLGSWIERLGIDTFDLVGHSFGGGLAQMLLMRFGARVRRLALVAPGGLGREVGFPLRLASLSRLVEMLGQPFMGAGTQLVMRGFGVAAGETTQPTDSKGGRAGVLSARRPFAPEDIELLAWMNARPGTARALARTVANVVDLRGQRRGLFDRVFTLRALPPTTLYWGDRDPIIPIRHAHDTAERLEGVTVTRFSGCGHFPHREQPAEFLRALESFLDARSLQPTIAKTTLALAPPERVSFWRRAWRAVVRAVGLIFRRIKVRKVAG